MRVTNHPQGKDSVDLGGPDYDFVGSDLTYVPVNLI